MPAHSSRPRPVRALIASATASILSFGVAACGPDDDADGTRTIGPRATADSADDASPSEPVVESTETEASLSGSVRLGFFPNVTHAPALVGVGDSSFEAALGDDVTLETFTFNAGTEAIEALFAGAIDVTFIGPNPAINGFAQSDGQALRIVSGSTSGGAYLVVRPEITSVEDLVGRSIATPSLGNTQDVALRAWLAEQGYETTPEGGGDVAILPQSNATSLEAFIAGSIDGAWVPEPWASRLILEGGGTVLVDERDLWPDTDGEYVTTHVIVRTEFLEEQPELVKAVLVGLADAIDSIAADPGAAQATVIEQIETITGQRPSEQAVAASFDNLTFTLDPIAASLEGSAADAVEVGLLDPVDLTGIYDLDLLDEVLAERGAGPVIAP